MLNNYLKLIQEQRNKNPIYQKDHYSFYLNKKNRTTIKEWEDIQRYNNARVINIVARETPLFKDTEEIYYYEFVDTSPSYKTKFNEWKYFYLPVETYKQTLINNNYLSSLNYYNAEEQIYKLIYPIKQYLYPLNRPKTYYINNSFINQTHPYSNNYIYTGIYTSNNNGEVIYEYVDYKMLTDDITITYYSNIPPNNYELRSKEAEYFSLKEEVALISYINRPPSILEWSSSFIPNYKFTGRSTTKQFSKGKTWYEYNVFINNQVAYQILLPHKPTLKNIDFVKIQLENKQMGLTFPIGYNIQRVIYKQISSNNKIIIGA